MPPNRGDPKTGLKTAIRTALFTALFIEKGRLHYVNNVLRIYRKRADEISKVSPELDRS